MDVVARMKRSAMREHPVIPGLRFAASGLRLCAAALIFAVAPAAAQEGGGPTPTATEDDYATVVENAVTGAIVPAYEHLEETTHDLLAETQGLCVAPSERNEGCAGDVVRRHGRRVGGRRLPPLRPDGARRALRALRLLAGRARHRRAAAEAVPLRRRPGAARARRAGRAERGRARPAGAGIAPLLRLQGAHDQRHARRLSLRPGAGDCRQHGRDRRRSARRLDHRRRLGIAHARARHQTIPSIARTRKR